ncbi:MULTISPECIES: ATP-binding protein [unclassified Streptomyces]|uniref:ATP-binding protein n=1 Tax=unclassified Streptomyces TaxID=2593676 RepID=UPI0004761D58|nr:MULTISPECIES: ATP-binding protein [unclassified Streptomyces]MYT32112.1 sensor histidine kinase [Streptomyces sp. SID8354]
MTSIPQALLWCLSAGTAAAVVLAALLVRVRKERAGLRARLTAAEEHNSATLHSNTELSARLRATEAEIRHLAEARLPDLTLALAHPHVPVRGLLDKRFGGSETDEALNAVLEQVSAAITKERTRVDAAAQSTLRGATTTIQALLYQVQTSLQTMQHKYDDPQIAQDLLEADFLNEQALRRVQATGVVCGAWPGLTREDSYLAELVVGATSRLRGYERVQISNQLRDPVAVVARAVEPIAITVTELLANALHHSHRELPVTVTLQQGNRGASVIIDDYGVGMHDDELKHAMELLAGSDSLLLTQLGDPPRSGFAAAGQLVRQYGYGVHVEPSPYGGVRAVVYIPGDPLLTVLDEGARPMSVMAPMPHRAPGGPRDRAAVPSAMPTGATAPATPAGAAPAAPPAAPAQPGPAHAAPAPAAAESTAPEPVQPPAEGELPRRRRRRPVAEQEVDTPTETLNLRSPEETGSRWAALQRGTESGRAAAQTEPPRSPEGNAQS